MNKNVFSIGLLALLGASTYALAKNSYALGYTQGAIDISNQMLKVLNEEKNKLKSSKNVSKDVWKRLREANDFDSRRTAKDIFKGLNWIAERNGFATVADFRILCDYTPMYEDSKYGWTKDEILKFKLIPFWDNTYSFIHLTPHKLCSQE